MFDTTININIDSGSMTADQAAQYAVDVITKVSTALGTSLATTAAAAPVFGVDKQLGRLMDHNSVFAPRVKRVHNELVALGYTPALPKSKKDPLPPYISFIDPSTGKNFGNLNSEKFYVMRQDLRDGLEKKEHFEADSRYAHCHLVSDHAVDALLKVAAAEKK